MSLDTTTARLQGHTLRRHILPWHYFAMHLQKDAQNTMTLLQGTRGIVVTRSDSVTLGTSRVAFSHHRVMSNPGPELQVGASTVGALSF